MINRIRRYLQTNNRVKKTNMPISENRMVFPCGMSRSGTTLLTTIIDSHSMISLGYELIPPVLPGPIDLLKILEHGEKLSCHDFSQCGQMLRREGAKKEGLFFTRSYRAGINALEIKEMLSKMHNKGFESIGTFRERLEVAWMIAKCAAQKKNSEIYGFKLNIPSVEKAFNYFPNSHLLYILRDPRDVVASHIQRKFDRTINDICTAWNNYLVSFEKFIKVNPNRGMSILYEDVVSRSETILPMIFNFLSLPMETSVYEFYRSKAGVHKFGHPNAENLKKDFFTTSIDRWKNDLDKQQIMQIEKLCGSKMAEYGYKQA